MSIENYTDDELIEALEAATDCYGDTVSQYRSEVAQFGDAWAGAGPQLDRIRAGLAELDREAARRWPAPPAAYSVEEIEVDDDHADIPF